ncbi:MAG: alpha-mannosidase [Clostridia bacterium]|nr:alpha-mannosidase [Clostridia bacterium]
MRVIKPPVLKNLITKYISPFIDEDKLVINEWKSYTGVHPEPGVIILDDKPAKTMRLGDRWDIGYDGTRFFEADVTVPENFAGRRVYLTLILGGETIVRINGKIVGAVNSRENSGWAARDDIIFPEPLKAGETLHLQLEAAVDCGGFADRARAGEKFMTYTMQKAELRLINEETEAFYYDINCAYEVYERTNDEITAKRVYNAVEKVAHVPDYDAGKERFYADVPKAREVLWSELSKIGFSIPGSVIMTGHSHLDVAWLWTVNEITRKCARTFANNLALMDMYPDFHFVQSQAAVYYFIKEYYPELYPKIKEKVKNGQWEITGNTWVEADTNVASGESLIRQLLYGREFFIKEFGVCSDIYWLPDCFGFTAALPQIIKRSGMKYFFTSKLNGNDTNEFPLSVFRWRAHSGDEVLAYMQKMSYNGNADALYITDVRKKNRQNDLTTKTLGCFGYGDGGGGCTYEMTERIRRYQKIPGMPEVKMGRVEEFYSDVEQCGDLLPVWDGEMYYENHRGTFTSQAFVKENNRKGEFMLRDIELLGVLSGGYDKEKAEKLWRILLTNQFHDILPGTSIHEVYINTRKEYKELREEGEALKNSLLEALSADFADENTVVVWNTLPHAVSGPVKVKVPARFRSVENAVCSVNSAENANIIEFIAENVPAVGFKRYYLSETNFGENANIACGLKLENEYLRAEFNSEGELVSLTDKENGFEALSGSGNLLSISHDKPIHESAWNLENDYKLHMDYLNTAQSVSVIENSALKGVIRVVRKYNASVITQDITLYSGSKRLDFCTHVNWQEREKVLKAEFPVSVRARYSTFNVAHGAVERPTFANNPYETAMFECCAHKWVDLSESGRGVALLNNCKYGHDITDNVMRITLMRGPVCPDKYGDIGEQDFVYSIYPHAGEWHSSGVICEAEKLNQPLSAVFCETGNKKEACRSFMSVSAENVSLEAVKQAQDGEGIIIRVNETAKKHTDAAIKLPFVPSRIFECSLMEQNESELPAGALLEFSIKPFEVKTFRII